MLALIEELGEFWGEVSGAFFGRLLGDVLSGEWGNRMFNGFVRPVGRGVVSQGVVIIDLFQSGARVKL